jgi:mRNA interferase MazF
LFRAISDDLGPVSSFKTTGLAPAFRRFVCPISSDLQDRFLLRPLIEVARENGLRLRSQIMTDKLVALRRDRIRRVIGRIDAETSEKLDRALLLVLGLAR